MGEITKEQIEELCRRLEGNASLFAPLMREAAALIRRLVAERGEAREERDIWRSVFPDIAPASVVPDRSLLESRAIAAEAEVGRLRAVLSEILDYEGGAATALEGIFSMTNRPIPFGAPMIRTKDTSS